MFGNDLIKLKLMLIISVLNSIMFRGHSVALNMYSLVMDPLARLSNIFSETFRCRILIH